MDHWSNQLVRLQACPEAVRWARDYDSLDAAWSASERGDWMLWLAGKAAGEPGSDARRTLVMAACDCAEPAVELFEAKIPGDARPRAALDTARRWARHESGVTLDQLRTAADATYYPAHVAYATDAASTAYSVAYAAAAVYATYSATPYAAWSESLKRSADRVRVHYPQPPKIGAARLKENPDAD